MNVVHSSSPRSWTVLATLWGISVDSPGPKPRYSVIEVARAGMRIADETGMDAVTLQAVAKELDLTTTALYRYVDAKETLVELMVDCALEPAPELKGPLAQTVRDWSAARWEVLVAHPWLSDTRTTSIARGPNSIAWQERLVAGLAGAGVQDPLGIARQLDILVRGHAAQARTAAPTDAPAWWSEAVGRTAPVSTELRLGEGARDPADDLRATIERLITSLVIESAYGVRPRIPPSS